MTKHYLLKRAFILKDARIFSLQQLMICANITNENSFVNCMKSVDQKVGGFQNKFKFRVAYWQLQTKQCFEENPKDLDTCKSKGRANIRQYMDGFVKSL